MLLRGNLSTAITHLARMSNGKLGGYKIASIHSGLIELSLLPENTEFEYEVQPSVVFKGDPTSVANLLETLAGIIREEQSKDHAQAIEHAGRYS